MSKLHTYRGDRVVTLDELRELPAPQSQGARHTPIPHFELVEQVNSGLERMNIKLDSMRWSLAREDQRLFGQLKVEPPKDAFNGHESSEHFFFERNGETPPMGFLLGVSHANDRSLALRFTAGAFIYVCSNRAYRPLGDQVDERRMHTRRNSSALEELIDDLLNRTMTSWQQFGGDVERLRERKLSDSQAKELLFDLFTLPEAPLPVRALPEVARTYFEHDSEDVAERNRWGIHNAFTRSMRELPDRRQIEASAMLTRLLTSDLN